MKAFRILCLLLPLAACASTVQPPPPAPPPPPPPVAHAKPPPVHHRSEKPAVASVGPLKTAMVGEYMDAQEKDFRMRLRPTGALVARVGDDLVVLWRNDMLFNGDDLSGRGKKSIEQLAELLRRYDHSVVQVSGFSDTVGSVQDALARSQRCAKAIAGGLVSDGVTPDRVTSQGFGATHLKFVTGPGASEPRNRRVEVRVTAHPQA